MALIIVESPTKARTFNRILSSEKYFVFATMGHIRDLPSNNMSIDYHRDFLPKYAIIKNKQKVVDELRKLAEQNEEIIFATDPDREGESISYHVAFLLGFIEEKWPKIEFKNGNIPKRIVFHEITKKALEDALQKPETIRIPLVKAQQVRRILDRVVGYELSPLLWKKMGKQWLSAGRVQTIALRLVVERENEILAFALEEYYQMNAQFKVEKENVNAKLSHFHNQAIEIKKTLNLFSGDYQFSKTTIDSNNVQDITKELKDDIYSLADIKEEEIKRYPPPPHTTSLLQQDAFYKFGFSSRMTMKLAQDLYEHGFITYHRTDSFNLSSYFVFRAKDYIEKEFGKDYTLEKPRGFHTKSKMAQEAHEAIRPTKLIRDFNKKGLTINHQKLYTLIFDRSIATQMKEASIKTVKLNISGKRENQFCCDLQQVIFDGFLKVLQPGFVTEHSKQIVFKKGADASLLNLEPVASQTKPPPRYNEASLIKILEEKGIGRPSTYAPIISLIQDKYYVEKENRYFRPTKLGTAISEYLSKAFPTLFNLDFTAGMEDNLDKIANDEIDFIDILKKFNDPFQKELAERKLDTSVIDVEEKIDEVCPKCSSKLTIRYSKFGKFMACSNYPNCKFTKSFLKIIPNKKCPQCASEIVVRYTKTRKRFYGCSKYPECKFSAWKLADLN